jgi:hypothetical protein
MDYDAAEECSSSDRQWNTMRHHRFETFALLLVLLSAFSAGADTWAAPTTVKVKSPNGRYTALVIPGPPGAGGETQGRKSARVHVYDGEPGAGGKWETLWAVTLTNEVAPVTVILTDDARHLITLDDWQSFGRGADTVAVYAREGKAGKQLARYSLEQSLTPDEIEAIRRACRPDGGATTRLRSSTNPPAASRSCACGSGSVAGGWRGT